MSTEPEQSKKKERKNNHTMPKPSSNVYTVEHAMWSSEFLSTVVHLHYGISV